MAEDALARQSAGLMAASLAGHAGGYVYHLICGRMLPDAEYGLLMALFGLVNLLLLPMSALGLALTRAVSVDLRERAGTGISCLLRRWLIGLTPAALGFWLVAALLSDRLNSELMMGRLAPLLLAALIPGLNLYLTLTGAALQGLQAFGVLAWRGLLLFVGRALLAGLCLGFGFRASGWALLAHLLAMGMALAYSLNGLRGRLPPGGSPAPTAAPILRGALRAAPVLLAFSALMTGDVILARLRFDPDISGRFAQATTLARMLLWLPLPIAQVMFPKVVRLGAPSADQTRTLRRAMGFTLLLTGLGLPAVWFGGGLALRWMYGIVEVDPLQIGWLRLAAAAMALLGPVHLLLQYELARGEARRLLPLCFWALLYPALAFSLPASPDTLVRILLGVSTGVLLSLIPLLRTRAN